MKIYYLLLSVLLLIGCTPDEDAITSPKWYPGQSILLNIYTDIDTIATQFTNDNNNFIRQLVNAPGYTYVYDNMMRQGEVITATASSLDSGYVHFDLTINGIKVASSSSTYNGDSTFAELNYILQ